MAATLLIDRLPQALSYEQYLEAWKAKLEMPLEDLDKDARRQVYYARYNDERAKRIDLLYAPSERLTRALVCIRERQAWVVITEDWCGDSAYSLPIMARAAVLNPAIDLRILPRDQHPDVMDLYLTNGARAIPKLIVLSAAGEEVFTWGAKPAEAKALREQLKAEGLDGKQIIAKTIEWYEQGGWQQVDTELAAAIEQAVCSR